MERPVSRENLSVAVALSAKLICGRLDSSTPTRAVLRSRPVIMASFLQEVVDGLPGRVAGAGDHLHVVRHLAPHALEERLRAPRGVLDQLERELGRRLDDALGLLDVGQSGQLHQDLVAPVAVGGDDRLRHPEGVDPALEGADRLLHRLLPHLALVDVGHLDGELPLPGLPHLPVGAEEVAQDVAHVLHPGRLHTLHREGGRALPLHRTVLDPLARGLVAERW